jgi:ribose transport system ATP-binding protein
VTAASLAKSEGSVVPVLELKGITKRFPGVVALNEVSFEIRRGEVHALLGENGAGKSTLMKVLAGVYRADDGHVLLDGKQVDPDNPLAAKQLGIVLIHQELSLVPDMSVAENIYLGSLPRKWGNRVDWAKLKADSQAIIDRLDSGFSATDRVSELSIAKQQMVEIARALAVSPKVVVFDEPTASLTQHEKDVLFDIIRSLQAQGVGIVYISHRMDEIFEISDRVTVLRDGEARGTVTTAETSEAAITRLMIGRDLQRTAKLQSDTPRKCCLKVAGLTIKGLFEDVSFDVSYGEVLGFSGLVGAGRTELAETIFGLRRPDAGEMRLDGEAKQFGSAADAIAAGISLVPENRKEQGLVLGMSCRENATLATLGQMTQFGVFVDRARENEVFEQYKDQLRIKTPSGEQIVGTLSGGNQQKVVIGKWLHTKPKLLILDEPTRGIDVGSKSEIHRLVRDLAASGYAVIVISSEMPEVLGVSDRILAMYHGSIVGELDGNTATEDDLVQAIMGQALARTA